MCDYSLELYRSQPAQQGETYKTHRFSSGSVGFVSPGDTSTAICMAYDMRLSLEGIPQSVQQACGVSANEVVTFSRLESGPYHDGVLFANGVEATLQQFGEGASATVLDALLSQRKERTVREPVDAM